MPNRKIILSIAILLCVGARAYAEVVKPETVPLTRNNGKDSKAVSTPAVLSTQSEKKPAIELKILKSQSDSLQASIESLTDSAMQMGISKMEMQGQRSAKALPGGSKKITITWDKAKLGDNTVALSSPFISSLVLTQASKKGEIAEGDKMKAIGNTDDLLAAWERLNEQKKATPPQAVIAARAATSSPVQPQSQQNTGSTGTTSSTAPASNSTGGTITPITSAVPASSPISPISPTYTVASPAPKTSLETSETTNGCTPRIDLTQLVAVVQSKAQINGVDASECSDTSTRYPLTRDHEACTVKIDAATLKVQKPYTLGYIDPINNSRVLVDNGNCYVDDSESIQMTSTPDNCSIRYDYSALKAYPQERIVYSDNGKTVEYRACSDTATIYAMTETPEGCPVVDNLAGGYASQQTKFTFTDSTGVLLTAKGCADSSDPKYKYAHVVTAEGCSIRDDLAAGKSYQQVRTYYVKDGKQVEVESCKDDAAQSYTQETTRDTCSPVITDSTVTQQTRKYIMVAGTRKYITECTPEATSSAIAEEPCADPNNLYTNDFDAGQSYPNVSHYYMDGSEKKYLNVCVKSDKVSYPHEKEEAGCPITNDDSTKTSTLSAKTVIKVSGEEITIDSTCKPLPQTVPYTKKEDRWTAVSTKENVALKPINNNDVTATVQNNVNSVANPDTSAIYPTGWQPYSPTPLIGHAGYMTGMYIPSANGSQYQWAFDKTGAGWTWVEYINNGNGMLGWRWDLYTKEYCRDGKINSPLQTADGLPINEQYSDAAPTFTTTMTPTGLTGNGCKYPLSSTKTFDSTGKGTNPAYGMAQCFNLTCSVPTCTKVTGKYKHTVYTRGDGSEFDDTATITDSIQVCGTGSKLINGGWDSFK